MFETSWKLLYSDHSGPMNVCILCVLYTFVSIQISEIDKLKI